VTYEAKKKGGNFFVIYIAGERFIFIYDVIVKQNKKKRPANHHSQLFIIGIAMSRRLSMRIHNHSL
jgi:hypothetical protein